MEIATFILTVVSMIMSAAAQQQQQQAANAQAQYKSKIAENNSITKKRLAEYERRRGDDVADRQKRNASLLAAKQRKGYAVSGVEFSGDSPLDVLEDTRGFGTLDALNTRHDSEMKAWQHEIGAESDLSQSQAYLAGQGSPLASTIPSLVSGASAALDKFGKIKFDKPDASNRGKS